VGCIGTPGDDRSGDRAEDAPGRIIFGAAEDDLESRADVSPGPGSKVAFKPRGLLVRWSFPGPSRLRVECFSGLVHAGPMA